MWIMIVIYILSLELVHSARVSHLLSQLNESPDDEKIFEGFMKAVDKVDREQVWEKQLVNIYSLF